MSTKTLVRTGLLLALALVFQIGFRQFAQPLVGPLVNMVLIIAALKVSPTSGIIIGSLTPIIAFLVGIMGLLPLVPIIILGNAIYVLIFSLISSKASFKFSDFISIIPAAILKYGFLTLAVQYLLPLFVAEVKPPIIAAFSLPQLYTALIGGLAAVAIAKFIPVKEIGTAS